MRRPQTLVPRLEIKVTPVFESSNKGINHCQTSSLEDTLTLMEHLDKPPSMDLITCLLDKCGERTDSFHAQRLLACACKHGLEYSITLQNQLFWTYMKCNNMNSAKQLLHKSFSQSDYTWALYIQWCVECKEYDFVLQLFHDLQQHQIHQNMLTIQAFMKACAKMQDLKTGFELHSNISQEGFESDSYIGTALVDMYMKCGALPEAQDMFDSLSHPSVVSWNALLAGYAEHSLCDDVSSCLTLMHSSGVSANDVTLFCCLKVYSCIECIDKGREMYIEAVKKGFDGDLFIINSLVDLYAHCGSFTDAEKVLNEAHISDTVTWNSLVSGYVDREKNDEALMCLDKMQEQGMLPDPVTLVCILKACGNIGAIERGREVHTEVLKFAYETHSSLGNILVHMYTKCGLHAEAEKIIHSLPVQDIISWNALISGYAEHGFAEDALNCLYKMKSKGLSPDGITHISCLKACGCIVAIDKGQEIHTEIVKEGLETYSSGNTLIDMYVKCDLLEEAYSVFKSLPIQNSVSWNVLLGGYADHGLGKEALKCLESMEDQGLALNAITILGGLKACTCIGDIQKGQQLHAMSIKKGYGGNQYVGTALVDMYGNDGWVLEARHVFDELQSESVLVWNTLLVIYAEHDLIHQALTCLEQMQWKTIFFDDVTHLLGVKVCGMAGVIEKGHEMHANIVMRDYLKHPFMQNAILEMYLKCGLLMEAQDLFNRLPARNVVTWTTIIMGYACQGQSLTAFQMLDRMLEGGVKPNELTLQSVLTACSHAGFVEGGLKYFWAMEGWFCIISTIQHHNCIIDLLVRAGQQHKALAILEYMPFEPDLVTWNNFGSNVSWFYHIKGSSEEQ